MEEYRYVDHKKLRCGYTTGSCAAAAAKAAAALLLTGRPPQLVRLMTPKGIPLELEVLEPALGPDWASCAIRKDSGDDPDVTNGVLVYARVSRWAEPGVTVDGGVGVGRVTKPGLECPVGWAAINSVPRRMIEEAVREACRQQAYDGGMSVVISIPEGERLAKKTYNPRLGIVGGLSVLGTSGIVEPMSEAALVDSIRVEMRMLTAGGAWYLAVTPGNYGEVFARERMGLDLSQAVKCSNFVGETLDYALQLGVQGILLVGHLGKFVKLAGGVFNTHSRWADCRMELIAAHAALAGAPQEGIARLMACITTDDALDLLDQMNLREPVLASLLKKIDFYCKARVCGELELGVVVFSNRYGLLGKTPDADALAARFRKETI